jgi:hypothetical protein
MKRIELLLGGEFGGLSGVDLVEDAHDRVDVGILYVGVAHIGRTVDAVERDAVVQIGSA